MRPVNLALLTFVLAAWLLVPLLGASDVLAQEAGADDINSPSRIDRQLVAGGYKLYVEAEASTLSLGTALVSVAVLNAENDAPIPGARVEIHTNHDESGETGWATALPVPERPEIYRARMKLEHPGPWDISIELDGPLGRAATHAGVINIPPPRQYWVGSVVFAGMSLVLLCGAAYVAWTIRRSMKRREASNAA